MTPTVGVVAVAVISSTFLTYFVAKFLWIFFLINKFPGPTDHPLIGNMRTTSSPREYFEERQRNLNKYRRISRGLMKYWRGPFPYLIVYGAEHMEKLLSENQKDTHKAINYAFLEPWLGTGLLTSEGRKWFQRRKLLTPTFHFSILQHFMDAFNEHSFILVEKMKKFANKPEPVDIFTAVTHCTLDIICDTAMGTHINAQNDSDSEYVKAVLRMGYLIVQRIRQPLLWSDSIFQCTQSGKEHYDTLRILHDFTRKIIHERLKESPKESIGSFEEGLRLRRKKIAFLDLLLKMHREDPSFTLEDIQEEVDTFMFEGHDTTAAAAGWGLFLLGLNVDVQARLHEELDEVFGNSDRPVSADDLTKLPYLTCVVKETLRVIPSVAAVDRELKKDIILDSKVVPKETKISLNIYALHQDPEYFPNPELFDPDRFLPENVNKRHPFAYIPFLAGSRNCIGQKFAMMEEKVIIATFLRKYSIEAVQSLEEARPTQLMITRPLEGKLWVKLATRK